MATRLYLVLTGETQGQRCAQQALGQKRGPHSHSFLEPHGEWDPEQALTPNPARWAFFPWLDLTGLLPWALT